MQGSGWSKEGCPKYGQLVSGVGWLPVSVHRCRLWPALLLSTKYGPRQGGVNNFRHRVPEHMLWTEC